MKRPIPVLSIVLLFVIAALGLTTGNTLLAVLATLVAGGSAFEMFKFRGGQPRSPKGSAVWCVILGALCFWNISVGVNNLAQGKTLIAVMNGCFALTTAVWLNVHRERAYL